MRTNAEYLQFLNDLQKKIEKKAPKNADKAECIEHILLARKLPIYGFDGDYRNVYCSFVKNAVAVLANLNLTDEEKRKCISKLVVCSEILVFFEEHDWD